MTALTDAFGRTHRYIRISVTDRCNLRCRYCMPAPGIAVRPKSELLTFDEIERVVRVTAAMGVRKVRLTGGEPLLRRDLPRLVERLRRVQGIDTLGMTTNGVLLSRFAGELRSSGLDTVNISLDTLRPERFERIALRPGLGAVVAGIDAALEAGFRPVKINVVVMGGVNDDEPADFVEFARGRPVALRFIEYMPFPENGWSAARFVPRDAMVERLRRRYRVEGPGEPGSASAIAREFRIEGLEHPVGFIASMSDQFCAGCDRLRLTADGSVKSCLFHPAEVTVREVLRSGAPDAAVASAIRGALASKPAAHPPMAELAGGTNRSMIAIGG
jgi:cyclic pyranopterin phosphate synthase